MSAPEEHVSARQLLDYHVRQRGLQMADLGVAATVVGCFSLAVARHLAAEAGAQRQELFQMYGEEMPLWTGSAGGQPVSFTRFYVGAPATIMQMEELIACGARRFIGLGWAGSLQQAAPVGDLLIPAACIREEGTSAHYLPPEAEVAPDPDLAAALAAAARAEGKEPHQGLHWTTDAPFRELNAKVADYRGRGVWGVDMETSAMFALGRFRAVAVANLLVISDELWHQWRPAFRTPELRTATEQAAAVVLRALAQLPPVSPG